MAIRPNVWPMAIRPNVWPFIRPGRMADGHTAKRMAVHTAERMADGHTAVWPMAIWPVSVLPNVLAQRYSIHSTQLLNLRFDFGYSKFVIQSEIL